MRFCFALGGVRLPRSVSIFSLLVQRTGETLLFALRGVHFLFARAKRKWTKRESTPGELRPAAAGGRRRQGAICAATPNAGRFLRLLAFGIVANRKGFRFPFPWTPSLKRQRRGLLPSFDSPRHCADLRDTRQRRTFPQVRQSPHLFPCGGRESEDAITCM